jgi:hypothetical protein
VTWFSVNQHGLLDTIDRYPTEWWLVYKDTDRPYWWNRWLKPGFRHVCAYRRDGRLWIAYQPDGGFLDIHVLRTDAQPWESEPHTAVQRVCVMRVANYLRARFFVGPLTCVEAVTALLGVQSWRVRTPWQLFQHVRRLQHAQPQDSRPDRRGNAAAGFAGGRAREA